MSISFEGIGEVIATFQVEEDGGVTAGDVVTVTGDGEVGLGISGGQFCGVAVNVAEDGAAGIQIAGLAVVHYTGTAPAVGYDILTADGAGNVMTAAENGFTYLVAAVDEAAKTAVIKL